MPHSYSTDSAERRIIPFFIAAAAIGSAYFTNHILLLLGWTPPWWIGPLDTMGYYGALYWLFNNVVWRANIVRRLRITRIPDLSGNWKGEILSSHESEGTPPAQSIDLSIQQTWREILVLADTDRSSSHSVSASILVNGICGLSYEYVNEPNTTAADTMHGHRGTARLLIKQDANRLEGDYYSGRDRLNTGRINLKRQA